MATNKDYNYFNTDKLPDGFDNMSSQEKAEWLAKNQANTDGDQSKEEMINMLDYYQHMADNEFAKEQVDTAYERSKAANQVQLLMNAGMTRQAALATLNGGSEQTAAAPSSMNALSAQNGINFDGVVNAVGTGIDALMNIANMGMNIAQFPYQMQQMRAAASMSKINEQMAQNYLTSMDQANAYTSAVGAAQGMEGFDPLVNGKDIASYMDFFAKNADKSPHFAHFNSKVANGLTAEAYKQINEGFAAGKNNEFVQNQLYQEALLRSVNFDNIEQTIANNKELLKGIGIDNQRKQAELDVYNLYGRDQAKANLELTQSETALNNSQKDLTDEEKKRQQFENYLNDMYKKYLWTEDYFSTISKAEHNRAQVYATQCAAANDPVTLKNITDKIQNDYAVARYVSAMQYYATKTSFEKIYGTTDKNGNPTGKGADADFAKWCVYWANPALANSLMGYYKSLDIYHNSLEQPLPGTNGYIFRNRDIVSPYDPF